MIIDLILDRRGFEKDGYDDYYDVEKFYRNVVAYGEIGEEIARALDSGTEKDVKQALCNYVIENDYNKNICKYINSVNWLEGFEESKKSARKSMKESTEITEPRMAWTSLLNHVCNFSTTIHSDSLWKALKKNPREEITLDEFVDECEKFVDMTKIRGMIEDYLGNDKQIEDNLKMYGLWNFSDKFAESKKSARKSLKEYRTVGFEQLVRDTIVSVLEDSHSDLFDLGMSDGILTYDVQGRSRITSNGDVEIDYLTLPTYFWSSGYTPSNKKMAKLCEDMIDSQMDYARERLWNENKDELIELGITDKDDKNLEYNALYDMGAGDLAEELSEYEMDLEGMDLYTDIYCELEETDEGIELTVSMAVQDEYGHALVKDYKSNTVLLQEDDNLEEVITDAIREVTKQF